MNFEDLAARLAAGLDAKYEDYDVRAARARLEDRILDEAGGWGDPDPSHPSDHVTSRPGDWRAQASCRGEEPERLFARGAEQRKAKLVCLGCPVRTECLAEALDLRIGFGVWGGMTERERRALLRRRPDVTSWLDLLTGAEQPYPVEAEVGESAERTVR